MDKPRRPDGSKKLYNENYQGDTNFHKEVGGGVKQFKVGGLDLIAIFY